MGARIKPLVLGTASLAFLGAILLEYGLSWLWSPGNVLIVGLAALGGMIGSLLSVHVPEGSKADRSLLAFSRWRTGWRERF